MNARQHMIDAIRSMGARMAATSTGHCVERAPATARTDAVYAHGAAQVEQAAVPRDRIGIENLRGNHRLGLRHQGRVGGDLVVAESLRPIGPGIGPVGAEPGLRQAAAEQRHGIA